MGTGVLCHWTKRAGLRVIVRDLAQGVNAAGHGAGPDGGGAGSPRTVRDEDFDLRPAVARHGRNASAFPSISPCHITVLLAAASAPPSVKVMTLPDREGPGAFEPEAVREGRPGADRLISAGDIRALFKLGRTAAYELTRRPGFPGPVRVSSRCLRWWASEVDAYAGTLQREGARRRTRRVPVRVVDEPSAVPRRITGTVRAARGRREPV